MLTENGKGSSVRVSMMLCVITACAVAIIATLKGQDPVGTGVLVAALLATGIGGKVIQKPKEGQPTD